MSQQWIARTATFFGVAIACAGCVPFATTAYVAADGLRTRDTVLRLGGEEFALLFSNVDALLRQAEEVPYGGKASGRNRSVLASAAAH